jgi:Holliday junction DNA helicase RuvB
VLTSQLRGQATLRRAVQEAELEEVRLVDVLDRLHLLADDRGDGSVTEEAAAEALRLLEIDARGLDAMDRQLLQAMADHHAGGPVGLSTMAATVSEPIETIEDVVEPYLMQIGLLARTARGRQLTPGAWAHLGMTPPPGGSVQPGLFDA